MATARNGTEIEAQIVKKGNQRYVTVTLAIDERFPLSASGKSNVAATTGGFSELGVKITNPKTGAEVNLLGNLTFVLGSR